MKKEIHLVGCNILVEKSKDEQKSAAGLILHESHEQTLVCGRVIQTGPGFLLPVVTDDSNDINSIISGKTEKPNYIPLDVMEGDTVYYHKNTGDDIYLNGKNYSIIAYPAIKLFLRASHPMT